MSISAKGSRKIVVGEIAYRWKIARHQRGGLPFVDLLISQEGTKGATLMQPFQTWLSPYLSPQIGPGQARAAILAGLKAGWKPVKAGPQVVLPLIHLTWESVPVVSPQKSLAHTLLYVSAELQALQAKESLLVNFRMDFVDGRHGVLHPQFLCDFSVSGDQLPALKSELETRSQKWLSEQGQMWAKPNREEWLRELGLLCWGSKVLGPPMQAHFRLHPVTKKDWVGHFVEKHCGFGNTSVEDFTAIGWKVADLIWDTFPDIWQVRDTSQVEKGKPILPISLFVAHPENKFMGGIIFS